MALIHHTRKGSGTPPLVFVHGFGCARSDWDAVIEHFGSRHETVAVDLGGHGTSPGGPEHRRIETHGQDVADLLKSLKLAPAVIFGHSMGCRIAMEAALRAPEHACAVMLVDGSRLGEKGSTAYLARAKAIESMGYAAFVRSAFAQMFAPSYDKAKAEVIIKRAVDRDPTIAGPLFADIGRYDAEHMDQTLSSLKVPLGAIQTTYTNAEGKRVSMKAGETTPYLDMIRRLVPDAKIDVIADTGHFPQLEKVAETNAIIERFLKGLGA